MRGPSALRGILWTAILTLHDEAKNAADTMSAYKPPKDTPVFRNAEQSALSPRAANL
jgi:hypothetical protein